MDFASENIEKTIGLYALPGKPLKYGTAGFRDRYELLYSTFVRMGVLACLRSLSHNGKVIGVMITASHNPERDNGIKLVDADGGMLSQTWEPFAEILANAPAEKFMAEVTSFAETMKIDLSKISCAKVMVGRDTRPHSAELSNCVLQGVEAMTRGHCDCFLDLGEVTTPQLHFVVQAINSSPPLAKLTSAGPTSLSVGAVRAAGAAVPPTTETFDCVAALTFYYATLAQGYLDLLATVPSPNSVVDCIVDASFGVGSKALVGFLHAFELIQASALNNSSQNAAGPFDSNFSRDISRLVFDIRNHSGTGPVNEGCGAELVQKNRVPPAGVSRTADVSKLITSFDGDADRIVFHAFTDDQGGWILIDGDKIAALFAAFFAKELRAAKLSDRFKLGVVQTAYANGAATRFMHEKGVETAIAKTGVKYVHHKALEFDIGVYFEANGHGTVVFSAAFKDALDAAFIAEQAGQATEETAEEIAGETAAKRGGVDGESENSRRWTAMLRLKASMAAINQAVGDALSDMIFCLAALQVLGMDYKAWDEMYTDLPSKQIKVPVPDKSLISCSTDETVVIQPAALQADLTKAMESVRFGRCFVRPSGTEDVVRIYAEAATVEEAGRLAEMCKVAIATHLGQVL